MEKRTPGRALFIVWRWKDPDSLWYAKKDHSQLHCISEDKLFEANLEAIADRLRTYSTLPQCLIFLHRKRHPNSYVQTLLKFMQEKLKFNNDGSLKCFLFGYGSDYLYLTKNPKGLLGSGELGGWVEYRDGRKEEYNVIQNLEKRTIWQENYDSVWNYYQHEFKMKLYLLERDLFLHFAPFTESEYSKNGTSLFTHLEADPPLALRLYSFVGESLDEKRADNYQELLFDDCSENLKAAYGPEASQAYEALRRSIDRVFLGNCLDKVQPQKAIPQVRRQFIQLRSLMPERISY